MGGGGLHRVQTLMDTWKDRGDGQRKHVQEGVLGEAQVWVIKSPGSMAPKWRMLAAGDCDE